MGLLVAKTEAVAVVGETASVIGAAAAAAAAVVSVCAVYVLLSSYK